MNNETKCNNQPRIKIKRFAGWQMGVLLLLFPLAAWAGGVVTNCTEADLRAAMAGGGTVTFACEGTITLASTITNALDTMLDATGHQITISGGDTVRVFYVQTNVTFTVTSLTIAHGRSTNNGAAICNQNGTVNATNTTFSSNAVVGAAGQTNAGGSVAGGAVANAGVIKLRNCIFTGNSAIGGAGSNGDYALPGFAGGSGTGGAVWNSGVLAGSGCTFAGSSATGGIGGNGGIGAGLPPGPGAPAGAGSGGALFNSGTASLVNCTLASNRAAGGAGGAGGYQGMSHGGNGAAGAAAGSGQGGAIYNSGTVRVVGTTFTSNSGSGADGGRGGFGATAFGQGGGNGGGGGAGGSGVGALCSPGAVQLINCTFASNSGSGGSGGAGGAGGSDWSYGPGGNGANGGNGGSGFGGISGYSSCLITNCTLAWNSGYGGTGGAGGSGGSGWPVGPNGSSGSSGSPGSGCGGIQASGSQLVNTLLGDSMFGGNCSGAIADLGYNLSSDNTCAFTNIGSMNNTPPLLSPLADNGGPTRTIALLPGSPAIDAGNTAAAPIMDQRGFPRPAGAEADIGAFEYGSTLPVLSIVRSGPGLFNILVQGNSNQWCRLLASSNLSFWVSVSTNQIGSDGTVLLKETSDLSRASWFYRVAKP
jgi:hypothetical protein